MNTKDIFIIKQLLSREGVCDESFSKLLGKMNYTCSGLIIGNSQYSSCPLYNICNSYYSVANQFGKKSFPILQKERINFCNTILKINNIKELINE